jgi:hypothetical protein
MPPRNRFNCNHSKTEGQILRHELSAATDFWSRGALRETDTHRHARAIAAAQRAAVAHLESLRLMREYAARPAPGFANPG